MVEITHTQARALLQVASDYPLDPRDRITLDAHLRSCTECNNYAKHLEILEKNLRRLMHTSWDVHQPTLDPQAIKNPAPLKLFWNSLLFGQTQVLGKVTVVTALLIGYFLIVNLTGNRLPITIEETPTALPTPNESALTSSALPTPSLQSTLLSLTFHDCNTDIYITQMNDTLDRIATRYGVTKDAILEYNPGNSDLGTNTLFPGTKLVIPHCGNTPARTTSLPGTTLTNTPIKGTILPE